MADLNTKLVWKGGNVCEAVAGEVAPIKVVAKSLLSDNPGTWSPVHMLVSAAETCFFVTFQMIAERARVEFTSFESEATGELGTPDGKHSAVTAVTIRPKVTLKNESDRPKLHNLFQKAEEYCTVGNSFNFKVKITE